MESALRNPVVINQRNQARDDLYVNDQLGYSKRIDEARGLIPNPWTMAREGG